MSRPGKLPIKHGKNGMAKGQWTKIIAFPFFLSTGMTSAPIRTNPAVPWVSPLARRLIYLPEIEVVLFFFTVDCTTLLLRGSSVSSSLREVFIYRLGPFMCPQTKLI